MSRELLAIKSKSRQSDESVDSIGTTIRQRKNAWSEDAMIATERYSQITADQLDLLHARMALRELRSSPERSRLFAKHAIEALDKQIKLSKNKAHSKNLLGLQLVMKSILNDRAKEPEIKRGLRDLRNIDNQRKDSLRQAKEEYYQIF